MRWEWKFHQRNGTDGSSLMRWRSRRFFSMGIRNPGSLSSGAKNSCDIRKYCANSLVATIRLSWKFYGMELIPETVAFSQWNSVQLRNLHWINFVATKNRIAFLSHLFLYIFRRYPNHPRYRSHEISKKGVSERTMCINDKRIVIKSEGNESCKKKRKSADDARGNSRI